MARSPPMPHASFRASRVAWGDRSSTCASILSLKREPRYRAIRHLDGIERRQKIGGIENLSEARDTPHRRTPTAQQARGRLHDDRRADRIDVSPRCRHATRGAILRYRHIHHEALIGAPPFRRSASAAAY